MKSRKKEAERIIDRMLKAYYEHLKFVSDPTRWEETRQEYVEYRKQLLELIEELENNDEKT